MTGGGRGLGRATCLALAREGADVALSYRASADGAAEVERELKALGVRAFAFAADATRPGEVGSFVDRAADALGGVDILVNNVGVFRRVPLEDVDEATLDEFLAVNVKAAVLASRAAAPHMRRRGGGAIVNVASLGGLRPWGAYLPYCASKAALIMATECLALALAPEIRVNAVAPGIVEPPGGPEAVRAKVPQRRFGTPEEVVETVLFLAAGAGYTTGEVVRVDGGRALA